MPRNGYIRTRQQEIVNAFLAASRGGDFDALLLAVLDPDVVVRADRAAVQIGASPEVRGAAAVAETFKGRARREPLMAPACDRVYLRRCRDDRTGFAIRGFEDRRLRGRSTTFCQARRMAARAVAPSASLSRTSVHPWRPHAPGAGVNTLGCARMSSRCSSGVSLTVPDCSFACSVAKILPLARKSG
jgi:hypothetical protein